MIWDAIKRATPDEIIRWAADQPWCQAMAACAQDADWHSEGDVWTHAKMVWEQLVALDEWSDLSPDDQRVLRFTALFHDIAKPMTSRVDPETGRVTSPNHAVKGEHVARAILRDMGCDLITREQICRLVRYHGRPAFLLEKKEPEHEVVRMSWLVSNRLLYLFALADTRGRKTDSVSRPEENLQFWRVQAQELDCFDQPYPFATDHARFTFLRQRRPNLYYVPHEESASRVVLLCGLPGSGKDTWIAQRHPELPTVSLDSIRRELGTDARENQGQVVQSARAACRELLRTGTTFVFNATNVVRQTRTRWINLFADYNARIELVYVEPPFERLLRQNSNREDPVPESIVRKLAGRCEPPTWAEGHSLILSSGEFDA